MLLGFLFVIFEVRNSDFEFVNDVRKGEINLDISYIWSGRILVNSYNIRVKIWWKGIR